MKREDLEKQGLSKEQIDAVLDMHHKEIDPVNKELETTKSDLTAAQEKVKTTEEALKAFDGVDPVALNQKIADLQKDLQTKDAEHQATIANRDFQDMLKKAIADAHGKDADKIIKLLDVDTLRNSQNQREDVAAALKAMAEDEVTSGMFVAQQKQDGIQPIGRIRQSAPLSPNYLDETYKGNPYYHPTQK